VGDRDVAKFILLRRKPSGISVGKQVNRSSKGFADDGKRFKFDSVVKSLKM